MTATYQLHYWPMLPGRGEFVRLALEAAGADYLDVAREDGKGRGMAGMQSVMDDARLVELPFAPPFLVHGKFVVGQTAAILLYLGPRLGLVGQSEKRRLWTHQLQLTIADVVTEVHDTHHPIAMGQVYEKQQDEARRRAKEFRRERIPKFLDWFERVLAQNPKGPAHLVGARLSYADLSLFQLVEGLRYAFPVGSRRTLKSVPKVRALCEGVRAHPRIAAYLASSRRMAFNEEGIFRRYPELDG